MSVQTFIYISCINVHILNQCELVFYLSAGTRQQFGLEFSPNLESNVFCPLFMTTSQPDLAQDMRPDLALFSPEIDAYRELGIFLRPIEIVCGIIVCKPG